MTLSKAAEAEEAWGEKRVFGKTREGIIRSTLMVDEEGKITKVFRRVKPVGDAKEVLSFF